MTDPLAYEAGITEDGVQLDVYDCLALAAQDAMADTAAAADAAAQEVLAQDAEWWAARGEDLYDDDPFVEQAHYADDYYADWGDDDYADDFVILDADDFLPDDDDFTFLPDYLRERG